MHDADPVTEPRRRWASWAWVWLLLLPCIGMGRSLLPRRVFLPQAPVAFEPLASEHPEAAEAAGVGANAWTSDGLFPTWTEQRGFRGELTAGRWPLWDPRSGIGAPRLGTTMVGPLGPLGALGVAFGAPGAGWLGLLRWCLLGGGVFLWVRRAGGSPGGALIGGLCAQAAGFLPMHLHHPMQVDALLPLPWMLASIEGLRRRYRGSAFALAILCACSFLAGFPPIAVFVAVTAAVYVLLRWWTVDAEDGRSGIVGRGWTALLLGGAIAAPQLIPSLEASSYSLRRPAAPEELVDQAPPIAALGSVVHPTWVGDPRHPRPSSGDPLLQRLVPGGESHRADGTAPLEWNLHLGVIALALALCAFGRGASSPGSSPHKGGPPPIAICAGLALGTLAFTLALPPVRGLLALPGFNLGAPGRIHGVTSVFVAGLAGWGWSRLEGNGGRRPRVVVLLLAVTLAWAGTLAVSTSDPAAWGSGLGEKLAGRHGVELAEVEARIPESAWIEAADHLHQGALGLGLLTLLILLILLRRRPSSLAVVLCLLAEGAWVSAPHGVPREVDSTALLPSSEGMQALARAADGGRVLRIDRSDDGVSEVLRLARPNLPQAYGISDLTPYTSLPDGRLTQLLEALDPESRFRSGASRLSDPGLLGSGILDLLNVTAVLALEPIPSEHLEPVEARPGFQVYHRPGALGPARVVERGLSPGSDRVALELLTSGTLDPRTTTVLAPGCELELPSPPEAATTPDGGPPATPRVSRPDPGHLLIDVELERPAWLVVHESAYPGWVAEVDGEPTPWTRADHVAMAVPLGPGVHRVAFRYRPKSLGLGLGIALVGLLCATLLLRRPASTDA